MTFSALTSKQLRILNMYIHVSSDHQQKTNKTNWQQLITSLSESSSVVHGHWRCQSFSPMGPTTFLLTGLYLTQSTSTCASYVLSHALQFPFLKPHSRISLGLVLNFAPQSKPLLWKTWSSFSFCAAHWLWPTAN